MHTLCSLINDGYFWSMLEAKSSRATGTGRLVDILDICSPIGSTVTVRPIVRAARTSRHTWANKKFTEETYCCRSKLRAFVRSFWLGSLRARRVEVRWSIFARKASSNVLELTLVSPLPIRNDWVLRGKLRRLLHSQEDVTASKPLVWGQQLHSGVTWCRHTC